jgi:hypothetical protein
MIAKELRTELALKNFLAANLWIQLELSELNYSLAELRIVAGRISP